MTTGNTDGIKGRDARATMCAILAKLDPSQRAAVRDVLAPYGARFAGSDVERIRRYCSKVARAENAQRGLDAGSPRALPGSTCVTVFRALCAAVSKGADAQEAHQTQRAIGALTETSANAADGAAAWGTLF